MGIQQASHAHWAVRSRDSRSVRPEVRLRLKQGRATDAYISSNKTSSVDCCKVVLVRRLSTAFGLPRRSNRFLFGVGGKLAISSRNMITFTVVYGFQSIPPTDGWKSLKTRRGSLIFLRSGMSRRFT